ncbi:Hypothetical predicted protein, partial [Paramuricea clavata]
STMDLRDHCVNFGLSDADEKCFQKPCGHKHEMKFGVPAIMPKKREKICCIVKNSLSVSIVENILKTLRSQNPSQGKDICDRIICPMKSALKTFACHESNGISHLESIRELQIKNKNAQQVPSDMMYECPQPGCNTIRKKNQKVCMTPLEETGQVAFPDYLITEMRKEMLTAFEVEYGATDRKPNLLLKIEELVEQLLIHHSNTKATTYANDSFEFEHLNPLLKIFNLEEHGYNSCGIVQCGLLWTFYDTGGRSERGLKHDL